MKRLTAEDILYVLNRNLATTPETARALSTINALVDNGGGQITAEDVLRMMNQELVTTPEAGLMVLGMNAWVDIQNRRLEIHTLEGEAAAAETEDCKLVDALAFVVFGDASYGSFNMQLGSPSPDQDRADYDSVEHALSLGGVGIIDSNLNQRIDQKTAHTVAALSIEQDGQSNRVIQIHHHPDITLKEAIGILKLAARERKQDRDQE